MTITNGGWQHTGRRQLGSKRSAGKKRSDMANGFCTPRRTGGLRTTEERPRLCHLTDRLCHLTHSLCHLTHRIGVRSYEHVLLPMAGRPMH